MIPMLEQDTVVERLTNPDGSVTISLIHRSFKGLAVVIGTIASLVLAAYTYDGGSSKTFFLSISLTLLPLWLVNRYLLRTIEAVMIEDKIIDKGTRVTGNYYLRVVGKDRPLEVTRDMFLAVQPGDEVLVTYGRLFAGVTRLILRVEK